MSKTTKRNRELYQKEYDRNKQSADRLYESMSDLPAPKYYEYEPDMSRTIPGPGRSKAFMEASKLLTQDSDFYRHPEMEADLEMQEAADEQLKNAKYQALRKILGM